MTETGLIIAEVAFVVLLYLFIWAIIRASSRQLRADPPPLPAPAEDAPLVVPLIDRSEPAVEAHHIEDAAEPYADPEPSPSPLTEPAAEAEPEPDGPLAPDFAPAPPSPTEIAGAAAAGGTIGALGGGGDPDESELELGDPLEASDAALADDDAFADDAAARRAERDPLLGLAADIHPRLVVEESPSLPVGEEFDLTGGVTVGRSGSSDLALTDQFVSHMHARILRRGQYYFVEDLGSTNGTFINDQRIERDAQLRVRDLLRMGDTTLRYEE